MFGEEMREGSNALGSLLLILIQALLELRFFDGTGGHGRVGIGIGIIILIIIATVIALLHPFFFILVFGLMHIVTHVLMQLRASAGNGDLPSSQCTCTRQS